jgi:hypothetical protein
MKGKQLALLLVVVIALGIAWFNRSSSDQAAWSETSRTGLKVLEFPINDVARLTIKTASSEVNLVRKDDVWTVQERANYPANFEQVSSLLRKLWDLKTVQEVKVGASQLPKLELVEPGKGDNAGTLVQFVAADGKEIASLLLGKKHLRKSDAPDMGFGGPSEGFPAGRYLKTGASPKVSLVAETLDEIDPAPTRWVATDFVNVEGVKTVAVKGAQTWALSRDSATAEWQLAGAKPDEKVDASKVSGLANILNGATISDVLAAETKAEPVVTASLATFDGFKYEVQIGKDEGDNVPVFVQVSASLEKERKAGAEEKPEDKTRLDEEFTKKQKELSEKLSKEKKLEGRGFLLPKFRVDALLKERSALLAEKPPEAPKADAPKVDAPKVDAPKVDAPKVDAPKVDAPKADAPKAEGEAPGGK